MALVFFAGLAVGPFALAARIRATASLRRARVEVGRGGSFEFHPAHEPQPAPQLYATQGMHAEPPMTKLTRATSPDVPLGRDARPARGKAVHAATGALPGLGKVHVQVRAHGVGPERAQRLDVHLEIDGAGANEAWADAALAAFPRELARRLGR